jgi:plasmid maintenance system antidote protein VapI
MTKLKPIHPGEILVEEFMRPYTEPTQACTRAARACADDLSDRAPEAPDL